MFKQKRSFWPVSLLSAIMVASLLAACGDNTATTAPAATTAAATTASSTTAASAATTAASTTTGAATVAGTTAATTGTTAAATTAAAATNIKKGGSIVIGLQTEVDHLDPYQATSADTRSVLFNVFEGLVKPDKDGNLVPAVAESLPVISADAITALTSRPRMLSTPSIPPLG
jgi:ABC-type transport system substrate-binding protein